MKTENVYAVLFNNGVLKVGRSAKPETRIKNHIDAASRHMIGYSVFMISEPVEDGRRAEAELIEYCSRTHKKTGNEYFLDADYALAREAMLSLGLLVTWGSEFKKSTFTGMTTISTHLGKPYALSEALEIRVVDVIKQVISGSKDGVVSRGIIDDRLRKKKLLNNKIMQLVDNLPSKHGIEVLKTRHAKNGKTITKYRLA